MKGRGVWILTGVVAVVVVVVIVFMTGGQPGGGASVDAAGDVVVEEGAGAPDDVTLADILEADVRRDGDRLIFDAQLAKGVPRRLRNGSLELRWDVSEGGENTWIISASVTIEATAAVISQKTPYGSSTIDGTMPGTVAIQGDRLVIEVEPGEIEDFPDVFEWRLQTTLDADLRDPASASARDSAPDQGVGRVAD